MIIGFIGSMGSGKTLTMVKYAFTYHKSGYKVYSNIKLRFPYDEYSLQGLLDLTENNKDLKKSVLLLDEAHIFIDSRNSVSKKNKIISYFLLQTRKKGCHLFYTTQRFHQIDKRLRDNTDILIKCYTKTTKKGEKYTLNIINTFKDDCLVTKKYLYESKKYYKLYDTYEVVRGI